MFYAGFIVEVAWNAHEVASVVVLLCFLLQSTPTHGNDALLPR